VVSNNASNALPEEDPIAVPVPVPSSRPAAASPNLQEVPPASPLKVEPTENAKVSGAYQPPPKTETPVEKATNNASNVLPEKAPIVEPASAPPSKPAAASPNPKEVPAASLTPPLKVVPSENPKVPGASQSTPKMETSTASATKLRELSKTTNGDYKKWTHNRLVIAIASFLIGGMVFALFGHRQSKDESQVAASAPPAPTGLNLAQDSAKFFDEVFSRAFFDNSRRPFEDMQRVEKSLLARYTPAEQLQTSFNDWYKQ
jgi:hypothetical protein